MRKVPQRVAKIRHFRLIKASIWVIILMVLDQLVSSSLFHGDIVEFIKLLNFALSSTT